jgi:opacity protein-like surface antigen
VNLSRSQTAYVPWTTNNGGLKTIATTVALDANDYVATVRPRIGLVATNNSLIYITGGWAFADIGITNKSTVFNQGAGGPGVPIHATWNSTSSAKNVGYALGVGFEVPVTPGVTFKAEYMHMRFDVSNAVAVNSTDLGGLYSLSSAMLTSVYSDFQIDTVRFGLNWKLFP